MKRLMAFAGFFVVFVAMGFFIAGDIYVFEWKVESRAALLFIPGIFAALGAVCPYLDLD